MDVTKLNIDNGGLKDEVTLVSIMRYSHQY